MRAFWSSRYKVDKMEISRLTCRLFSRFKAGFPTVSTPLHNLYPFFGKRFGFEPQAPPLANQLRCFPHFDWVVFTIGESPRVMPWKTLWQRGRYFVRKRLHDLFVLSVLFRSLTSSACWAHLQRFNSSHHCMHYSRSQRSKALGTEILSSSLTT